MRTADFDYALPPELIAQQARPRGTSRLLVLERASGRVHLERITALPTWLEPGDLMLLNDVKVIPARLAASRPGGGETELLLVRPLGDGSWEVMARPAKRLHVGTTLALREGTAVPLERLEGGRWRVAFAPPLSEEVLATVGEVPLPPYIERPGGPSEADRARYQTVYAGRGRAVAAPTAGLHFTPELLGAIADRGVEVVPDAARRAGHLPARAGRGRPRAPPRGRGLRDLRGAALAINRALAAGRRIVAVGTTSCRALEHAVASGTGRVRPGPARSDLFIAPGYRWRAVGALLTNFHLPRSTLLMLVAALAGRERALAAYERAIAERFAFYSFGDAMLVV